MIITQKLAPPSSTINPNCSIHVLDVVITDVAKRTADIAADVIATSWVASIGAIHIQNAYSARSKATISKLVNVVLKTISNQIDDDLGEYIVSTSAHDSLAIQYSHKKVPLAELIKEKKDGNPGFDFHTESPAYIIIFGEAKYSGSISPYKKAASQIERFFQAQKDVMEIADLIHFTSSQAITNHLNNKKGCTAAFSVNAKNPDTIYSNLFASPEFKALTKYDEIYVVGVRIA